MSLTRAELLYNDRSIRISETFQIGFVDGQNDSTARLDRGLDDVGVGKVFGPGPCSAEDSADKPGEDPVGVTQLQGLGLAGQQRVDHLISPGAPIELRQDHRRHGHVTSETMRRSHRSSDLELRVARTGSERTDGGLIEHKLHTGPPIRRM